MLRAASQKNEQPSVLFLVIPTHSTIRKHQADLFALAMALFFLFFKSFFFKLIIIIIKGIIIIQTWRTALLPRRNASQSGRSGRVCSIYPDRR
jgi:hypothetical protein